MSINLIMFIVSLGTLGLVIYLFLKVREQNIQEINQSSLMEEKFKNFSDDIKEIGRELVSVTTPINELSRFLGGNVTTGRLGEWNLESIVRDIMPDGSYEFQHIINSQTSDQVDCAVTTAEGIIVPIDSKLYAGQYRQYQDAGNDADRKRVLRDLRTAVLRDADDIADKYILQNTVNLLQICNTHIKAVVKLASSPSRIVTVLAQAPQEGVVDKG